MNAQTDYTIHGRVSDENGVAVSFANIALRDVSDSTLFGGTITDENGYFNFRHTLEGTYLLKVSFIGYEPVLRTLTPVSGEETNTGNIILKKDRNLLNEVVIRQNRKRAKQQANLTTYFVNSNMRNGSQTGIDLLGQVPDVGVDLMKTISLNGSTEIIILVNGIKRSSEFLGQIDADQIDRIEIRSLGGLRYGATVAGVINVVLKKDESKGSSGHLYANLPTQFDEVFSFPSASLNLRTDNTTWYTSYNASFSNFRIEGLHHKTISSDTQPMEIIRTDSLRQDNWSHKLHFGMDRFINERTQLSLYGFVSGFSNEQDGKFLIETNAEDSEIASYQIEKDDLDRNRSAYGSLFFKHKFNPSGEITFEGGYYLLKSQTGLALKNLESDFRQVSQSEPVLNNIDLRAEYSSSINENVSLQTGLQQQLYFMGDNNFSSFNYSNRIYAAYLQGAFNWEKFQLNGGVRAEHSTVIYSDVMNDNRLFLLPQLNIRYEFTGKISLKISYHKRVNRPQIHQLNPAVTISDRYTINQGNPGLFPEIIQKFSAMNSISIKENFLSFGVFYKRKDNAIEQLTTLSDTGMFCLQRQNLGEIHYKGVKALGSMNLHDKLSINTDLEFYHVQTRVSDLAYNQGINDRSRLEIRGKMAAIYAIKRDLSLSASLQFQSSATGIQHQYREGVLYFISLKKSFFDRLKLELTSAIPFMRSFTYQGYDLIGDDFTLFSEDNIKMSMVPVWFKLKYSFVSGGKVRHLDRKNVFKEERVKKGF